MQDRIVGWQLPRRACRADCWRGPNAAGRGVSRAPASRADRGVATRTLEPPSLNSRLGDSGAALFSTMLGAYFHETKTAPAHLRAQILGDRTSPMNEIVRRAVERGELAAPLPARVATLPFDLLRHELLMNLRRASEETILDILDTLFLPLVEAQRVRAGASGHGPSQDPGSRGGSSARS